MSNTTINCSIPDTALGQLLSDPGRDPGFFTPGFQNFTGAGKDVDVSIDTDNIGGFSVALETDLTFPSGMTKARITLPSFSIESQSTWLDDATVWANPAMSAGSIFKATVALDFRLSIVDGDNTELATVSYGANPFTVYTNKYNQPGTSSIGFYYPTLSPATSTVDITLGSNKAISFKLYVEDGSTALSWALTRSFVTGDLL